MSEYFLGLMSGTSLDGIDAAIVDFGGSFPTIYAAHTVPFEPELRQAILSLAQGQTTHEIETLGTLDTRLGEHFAQAALILIEHSGLPRNAIRAIGSHGQTIRHRPEVQHHRLKWLTQQLPSGFQPPSFRIFRHQAQTCS